MERKNFYSGISILALGVFTDQFTTHVGLNLGLPEKNLVPNLAIDMLGKFGVTALEVAGFAAVALLAIKYFKKNPVGSTLMLRGINMALAFACLNNTITILSHLLH